MSMRRHLASLGLGASLLVVMGCSAAAGTHRVSVLGADVVLSIPKGHCALDKHNRADNEVISALEQVNAGRNAILLMFADCKELETYRATGESVSNSGVYMAPGSARQPVRMSRAQFVAKVAEVFRQQQPLVAKGHEEAKRRVKAHGAEIDQNVSLGLLRSDETALYTGVMQTWQVEGGGKVQVATVTGLTVVRERVISINLSADYKGRDTVTALLATQRGLIRALIAANEGG